MAIYHLSAKIISRNNGRGGVPFRVGDEVRGGRSVIAAAAYRSGTRMHDKRLDQTFDYREKSVAESRIMLPDGAPSWASDRARLWNEVEASERRINSQLARELEIALPRELTAEQQRECLEGYLQKHCVDRGMVADYAIHREDPGNPHAHVLLTLREFGPEGLGAKRREWNDKQLLLEWRHAWELAANHALALAGREERIDHRSYAERGVTLEAAPKVYRAPSHAEGDAFVAERVQLVREVARRNGEKLEANPVLALSLLPPGRRVFTKHDLARTVSRHTDDPDQFQRVFGKVLAVEDLVDLGVGADGQQRYTRREHVLDVAAERSIEALAEHLGRETHHQVPAPVVDRAVEVVAGQGITLSAEQVAAVRHIVSDSGRLALVQGHAGTGKSVALGAARSAWEADGLTVVGAAVAGKAADGLQEGSGIPSRTIAAWLKAWDRGEHQLTPRSVLVIDEAGMVGNAQMQEVLRAVSRAGAKVVLVGDHGQLQPIDSGTPMRALVDQVGAATLAHIRRQRVPWQVDASRALAAAKVDEALDLYAGHGHVRAVASKELALEAAVRSWVHDQREHPTASQLLLAYRRTDVAELNALARAYRVQAGELADGVEVETAAGRLQVAVDERIYLTRNDAELGVTNGSLGTVTAIDGRVLTVELDGGNVVHVDTDRYPHLAHGYAATVHKAQGVTVDRAYVVADPLFDRHATYVALTRHRDHVELHYATEQFPTEAQLRKSLGQVAQRDRGTRWEDTKALADHLDGAGQREKRTREQVFAAMPLERQEAHLARLRRILRRPPPAAPAIDTPHARQRHADDLRWREIEKREAQREFARFETIVTERRALAAAGAAPEAVAQLRRQAALPASRERAEWAVPEIREASARLKEARVSLRASRSFVARAGAARRLARAKHDLELVRERPDIRRRVEAIRAEQHHRQLRALRVHARGPHVEENPMSLHQPSTPKPFELPVPQSNLRHHTTVDGGEAARHARNAEVLRQDPASFTSTLPSTFTREELAVALAPHVSTSAAPGLLRDLHERGVVQSLGIGPDGKETFTAEPFDAGTRAERFAELTRPEQQRSVEAALQDFYGPTHDAEIELRREPLLVGTQMLVDARKRELAQVDRALATVRAQGHEGREAAAVIAQQARARRQLDQALDLHRVVLDDPHRVAYHQQLHSESVARRAAGFEAYEAHRGQLVESVAAQYDQLDAAKRQQVVARLHQQLEPRVVIPVPDHLTPQQGADALRKTRNTLSSVPEVRAAQREYQAALQEAGVSPSAKAASRVLDTAANVVLVSKAPAVIEQAEAVAQRSLATRAVASDALRHLHDTRGVEVALNKLEPRLEWSRDLGAQLLEAQDRRLRVGLEAGAPERTRPDLERLRRGPENGPALLAHPERVLPAVNPAGEVLSEREFLARLHQPDDPGLGAAIYSAAVKNGVVLEVQPPALRGERLVVPGAHPLAAAISRGAQPTLEQQVDRAIRLATPEAPSPTLAEHPTVVGIARELSALRPDDLSPRAVAARAELPVRVAALTTTPALDHQHALLRPAFPREELARVELSSERCQRLDAVLETKFASLSPERQRALLELGIARASHIEDPVQREARRNAMVAVHQQTQVEQFRAQPVQQQARVLETRALPENLQANLRIVHEHAQQKWFVALPTAQQAAVLANLKQEASREPSALTAAEDVPALRRPLRAYHQAVEGVKLAVLPGERVRAAHAVSAARAELKTVAQVPAIKLQVAAALRAQQSRREIATKDLAFYQVVALRLTRSQGMQR